MLKLYIQKRKKKAEIVVKIKNDFEEYKKIIKIEDLETYKENKRRKKDIYKDHEDVLDEYDSFCENLKDDIIKCLDILIQEGRDDLDHLYLHDFEEDDLIPSEIKEEKLGYIESFMEIMEDEFLKRLKKAECTDWSEQFSKYLKRFENYLTCSIFRK